jgi:hypothetical protein
MNWACPSEGEIGSQMQFLFYKALIGLLAFDALLMSRGFAGIHRFVRNWKLAPRAAAPYAIDHVCTAVKYACICYPKRARCLQQSAVITCLLRSCGVPAQMVMGGVDRPFKAHAWVEVNGCAILEDRDVQSLYKVWERC